MNGTKELSQIWSEYEACEQVHTQMGIEENTAKAYRFYEGNQWYGLESGNEDMPVYNFIAPLVRYKTSMVAMNNMCINYSAPTLEKKQEDICASLSKLAMQKWERLKMDSKCWQAVKAAMISGDSYVYFYNGDGDCQVIDRTDVFFADETLSDINAQPYIFIRERKSVSQIKKIAKQNGISQTDVDSIVADEDENELSSDKCTSLLYMYLEDGNLYFTRLTKNVIYEKTQVIENLGIYPIASLVYQRQRGSCRGLGEVIPLVANQIEINRNLARRLLNAKLTAYSRLVYSSDRISNPSALTEVGTAIEVDGAGVSSVKEAVDYLTPSSMSPDARNLSDELLAVTKELSGAGDAVLGNVDPTQASGTAIIAVRDQAALPLNEQTAYFKQFVEDIAIIWYRLWSVYGTGETEWSELSGIMPDVRIDVSSTSPFSKYAREQAVERLFSMGHITFEEYVSALEDDSSVPKSKLEHIIKKRGGSINADREN